MHSLMSGEDYFRMLMDVISYRGGMSSLVTARKEALGQETSDALLDKYFTAQKSQDVDDMLDDKPAQRLLSPMAESDPAVTAARRGRVNDWSLWRERAVLLALRLLDSALSNDGAFLEAVRGRCQQSHACPVPRRARVWRYPLLTRAAAAAADACDGLQGQPAAPVAAVG